jgi:hypothetical protein
MNERGGDMFGKKKRMTPPDTPFQHADGCKILVADPATVIPWSEEEIGHFVRVCTCTTEHWRAPQPARVRLDPYDPATMRHLGECEFKNETNHDVLKILLKVKPGMGPDYQWVECGSCGSAWPVADYAEESVR